MVLPLRCRAERRVIMGEFYLEVGICAADGEAVQVLGVKVNAGVRYSVLPGRLVNVVVG